MTGPRPVTSPGTQLSSSDERRFRAWVQQNGITDLDHPDSHYDYRGYWLETHGAPHKKGTHFPDTYKLPGEPTFSVESKYYIPGVTPAGSWDGDRFIPPPAEQARRERLRAKIAQLDHEALQENWSPRTRALGFALSLARQFNVLGEGGMGQMTPEEGAKALAQDVDRPGGDPITRGDAPPEQSIKDFYGGIYDRLSRALDRRDPELLGSVAGLAAPLGPAAVDRIAALDEAGALGPSSLGRLDVEHRSPVPNLTTIDPANFGSGPIKGAERVRKQAFPELFLPRSYFAVAGSPVEAGFEHLPTYRASLDPSRIYDIENDPLGLGNKAMERGAAKGQFGPAIHSYLEQEIKDAGFMGYRNGNTIASFEPVSVNAPPKPLSDVVANYRQQAGITSAPLPRVTAVDAEAGARMARTYEGLQNAPNDPDVRAAYKAFTDETASQAQALRDAGYSWDYVDKDPYKNSAEMLKDLRDNQHINVLKTDPAQGHPLMTPDQNDLFRAVHDIIGHGVEGNNFAAPGEENAFRGHAATYSPLAQRAMATDTRGQNSWFNYGPHSDLPAPQRPFATQKAALWPTEQLGDYGTFPKEQPDVPAFEENAPVPAALPDYIGGHMAKGDVTRFGESLAHHLAGAPDQGAWLANVTKENPRLGRMLASDPALTQQVYQDAVPHRDFVNDLLPYSEIAEKAAAGGPAWDNWYGVYVKALRDAGVPEEAVQRMLKTSTILSTRKAPVDEVLTALRSWRAHEAGEPITTQTTQHTSKITDAATEAIRGGASWARNAQGTLRLRQKISNYLLSELTGGKGEAPTLDTWHARAYLGPNISKYLDAKGNLDLTDAQWRVMQARTLADASRARLPAGDFQARVWGGENGYVPSYGESGANRADLLAQHLGSGAFDDLIRKFPGLGDLAEQGRAATEAFGSEAALARQKQLDLFSYLRSR